MTPLVKWTSRPTWQVGVNRQTPHSLLFALDLARLHPSCIGLLQLPCARSLRAPACHHAAPPKDRPARARSARRRATPSTTAAPGTATPTCSPSSSSSTTRPRPTTSPTATPTRTRTSRSPGSTRRAQARPPAPTPSLTHTHTPAPSDSPPPPHTHWILARSFARQGGVHPGAFLAHAHRPPTARPLLPHRSATPLPRLLPRPSPFSPRSSSTRSTAPACPSTAAGSSAAPSRRVRHPPRPFPPPPPRRRAHASAGPGANYDAQLERV